ncbi:MAG: hypothetical protein WCP52_11860, partial [Bacteroidota bacterium]
MEELLKLILKVLKDDPYSIIKDLFKAMRTILLIIISAFFYRYFISDFKLVENFNALFLFFISGDFLKPLTVFIITWMIFDVS